MNKDEGIHIIRVGRFFMYKLWNQLKEAKNYQWVELSHSLTNESPYWAGYQKVR